MKFLQIQVLYETFISQLYSSDCLLNNKCYEYQLSKILSSKFSFSHYLCEELSKLGFTTDIIFPNAQSLQAQWAKENGLSVKEILVEQIERFKPDILYIVGAVGCLDSSLLYKLKHKPKLTFGWLGSNIPPKTDWSRFDCILSGLSELRKTALRLGAKHSMEFYPGIPQVVFDDFPCLNNNPHYDLVFVGQCNPVQHGKRASFLEFLANQGLNLGLFLSGNISHLPTILQEINKGPRFGYEMLQEIYNSKISFDCRAKHSFLDKDIGKDQTVNMRIFETTAVGSLLLTEKFSNLNKLFEPNKDIVSFTNTTDLIEKIKYYIENHTTRKTISINGKMKCKNKHKLSLRALHFANIVEHLSKK